MANSAVEVPVTCGGGSHDVHTWDLHIFKGLFKFLQKLTSNALSPGGGMTVNVQMSGKVFKMLLKEGHMRLNAPEFNIMAMLGTKAITKYTLTYGHPDMPRKMFEVIA